MMNSKEDDPPNILVSVSMRYSEWLEIRNSLKFMEKCPDQIKKIDYYLSSVFSSKMKAGVV